MEIFTIVLSGLLGALVPIGFITDSIVANNLKKRIEGAEVLTIRIDNEPSYQLIKGKVNKVRIATRKLELIPDLIIDTLEIETDPIDLDLKTLRAGGENSFNRSLRKPLQGGVRLVITQDDLNRALTSPRIDAILQQAVNRAFNATNYKLLNPQIKLLDNNRIAASATIDRGEESTPLDIIFELGINLVEGRKLELIDIEASIGQRRLPKRFLASFARGINERLDLGRLDERGITAVLFQLETQEEKLNIAGFVAIEGSKLNTEELN
ncbi:MAG: DUF2993 domain-containing protein [Prochloraceae cyanobacterium]